MTLVLVRSGSILALVAALAAGGCKKREQADAPHIGPAADENAPVHVTTAAAQARQVPLTLQLTGTLIPDQQSELTPLVAGRVDQVFIERGTPVHQGQPLFHLRDVDYRSSAASASAALSQARARLGIDGHERFDAESTADVRAARSNRDIAEDTLRRTQQLARTGAASDQDLQRATSQAATAREQYNTALNNVRASYFAYQSARVAVGQSQRNVEDSLVRAPFDGEVAERRANIGEYVTTQRAVATIVRTDPLRIELQIPQEKIPYVQVGQAVSVAVDAFPDRTFRGTVRYISASVRSDSRSLIAEAVVPNTDHSLRPGIFVTARVDLGRQQPVAVVPADAVLSEGGAHRAFVIGADGRAQERIVTVTDHVEGSILISHGIQAGERVATSGLERLADGARVQQ